VAKDKYQSVGSMKPGTCFKMKGDRNIFMRDNEEGYQQLTGKDAGSFEIIPFDDEEGRTVNVQINEIKS